MRRLLMVVVAGAIVGSVAACANVLGFKDLTGATDSISTDDAGNDEAAAADSGDAGPQYSAVSIAAGLTHTCAALTDGRVVCWGNGGLGEVGPHAGAKTLVPHEVLPLAQPAVAVCVGDHHSCAIEKDGRMECWGSNTNGQLGHGSTATAKVPVSVAQFAAATQCVAGSQHTCALTAAGAVACWGANDSGQLGTGTSDLLDALPQTVPLSGVLGLSSSYSHTCAILGDGSVSCWGEEVYGSLGGGSTSFNLVTKPRQIPGLASTIGDGKVSIAVGQDHGCALQMPSAACWGINDEGQLGRGSTATVDQAFTAGVLVPPQAFAAIAVGTRSTFALDAAGDAVWAWGAMSSSDNSTRQDFGHTPTRFAGLGAVEISIKASHACTRTAAGRVFCFGQNDYGQLGRGTATAYESQPQLVSGF